MNQHKDPFIDGSSPAIHTHLTIMQDVIQRMAANSSSSKTWCVTLVSAVLVIVADKDKPEYTWIAMLPTIALAALDVYYLALEKGFRKAYNVFTGKFHTGTLKPRDLYTVTLEGNLKSLLIESCRSFSIWGFYLSMAVLIAFTKKIAIG